MVSKTHRGETGCLSPGQYNANWFPLTFAKIRLAVLVFFPRLLLLLIVWIGILAAHNEALAQKKEKKEDPFKFSSTTDFYNAERFEGKEKSRYRYLYAYNMNKVLYGNQCVTEVTHQYGFEYIPAFDSAQEPRNDLQIWAHNFFTNVAITFRHGLFWKRKVRKRIKYCAESSGDFIG